VQLLLPWIIIAVGSYLFGSIPFGYLAGRLCGIDIRTKGSGNIGATNVLRVMGKKWGYAVFLLDFIKGWLPVKLALGWGIALMVHPASAPGALAGLFVLLGHSFPVWLGFKGGKGMSSSGGVIIALFPSAFLIGIGTWILVFTTTRYVSVASIAGSVAVPLAVLAMYLLHRADWLGVAVSVVMATLIIWLHRGNIARLRAGTESRFEKKKS
jgi:acyl phosphate:glycerol-3-phosphate acyltransferase